MRPTSTTRDDDERTSMTDEHRFGSHKTRRAFLVGFLIVMFACGDRPESANAPATGGPSEASGAPTSAAGGIVGRPGHRFEIADEGGVPVARTTGGPMFEGELFDNELVLTLHQDPARQESMLYRPRGVLADPAGDFFVLDSGNSRIAVFDASGEFVRAFGRSGQGPGELSGLGVLQSLQDGALSVFDLQQQRTTLFGTDGSIVDDVSHGGIPVSNLEILPDGRLLKIGGVFDDVDSGIQARRAQVFSSDGSQVLATMETSMVKMSTVEVITVSENEVVSRSVSVPYAARPFAAHVPGRGLLLSAGDTPELTLYDYAGLPTRIVRIDLPAHPITAAMREQYETRRRQSLREAAERDGRDPPQVPNSEFPEQAGFWQRFTVDDRGFTWLQDVVTTTEREEGDPWTFHVLDPEGRYLGTTRLPVARPSFSDGRVMGTVTDPDNGDTEVRIYRLRPRPAGFDYTSRTDDR